MAKKGWVPKVLWGLAGTLLAFFALGSAIQKTCVAGNSDYEKGVGICQGNGRKDDELKKAEAKEKAIKAKERKIRNEKAIATNKKQKTVPVQFGAEDDLGAWLSRCAPPESDTTTAYDNPRPPIPTRLLSYPSKGVRVILTANGPIGSPPPYSSWRLVGLTDQGNDQPLQPTEALRRMGDSCRRG